MTKEQLLARLKECELNGDTEASHVDADMALLEFIGDPEVTAAFNAIDKWYV